MSLDLEEETASGSSTSVAKDGTQLVPMDLLDEYWFFHNTLNTRRLPPRSPPSPNKGNESSGVGTSTEKPSEDIRIARRPLLATPPRVGPDGAGREEVAVPSESSNPKLRHSLSSLDDRHRLQYSSSKRIIAPIPSINSRRRQPRDIRVEGINKYCANQHYLIREANYRKAFQEKKWKSLSDLEFIEVQGFKDLGFVFDEEGTSSASLANVIPGLRDKKAGELGDDKVRRPYLSEAWFVQRSAPPMIKWVDKRSAADMKEQLKFWARAVACNVRQEC